MIVLVSKEEGDAMTNELIGIVGALVLTFLLFVLRHFILPSERGNKHRHITPMAHRENHELNEKAVEDDAWLLWAPGDEAESSVDRGQSHEPRGGGEKGVMKTALLEVKSDDLERNKESGRRSRHF
jgi:hypothetical protein